MHIELTLSSVARLEGITVREWTIATRGSKQQGARSKGSGVVALDERTGETLEFGAGLWSWRRAGRGGCTR